MTSRMSDHWGAQGVDTRTRRMSGWSLAEGALDCAPPPCSCEGQKHDPWRGAAVHRQTLIKPRSVAPVTSVQKTSAHTGLVNFWLPSMTTTGEERPALAHWSTRKRRMCASYAGSVAESNASNGPDKRTSLKMPCSHWRSRYRSRNQPSRMRLPSLPLSVHSSGTVWTKASDSKLAFCSASRCVNCRYQARVTPKRGVIMMVGGRTRAVLGHVQTARPVAMKLAHCLAPPAWQVEERLQMPERCFRT
eukprot:15468901-Alexandrium_andersonii.AAC.1